MIPEKYVYKAYVTRIIDGDTVEAHIDLGLWIWVHNRHVRLLGINMPERRDPLGPSATAKLRELCFLQIVTLQTQLDRSDKYGRLLATMWVGQTNVNDAMKTWMENNHA